MTEFEKYWEAHGEDAFRNMAEKLWHAAQRAAIRTITTEPAFIPKPGDKVVFQSLCHSSSIGKVREVREVRKEGIEDVYWVETSYVDPKHGLVYSGGILGECRLATEEDE